jgi:hypothetical protein
MRVLVLATNYFGVGGAEAYIRMFAEAITADGDLVEVLSLLDGKAADRGAARSRAIGLTQARLCG